MTNQAIIDRLKAILAMLEARVYEAISPRIRQDISKHLAEIADIIEPTELKP